MGLAILTRHKYGEIVFLKNKLIYGFVTIFWVTSGVAVSYHEGDNWDNVRVQHELTTNRDKIEQFREGKDIALPLAMAGWASDKAKLADAENDKKKYATLARTILNEATGFGWAPRGATASEIACMAQTSVSLALTTTDKVEALWDGKEAGRKTYYDFLQRMARSARVIGPKANYLTDLGVVTWARLPGVRADFIELFENMKSNSPSRFFTPSTKLVKITSGEEGEKWWSLDKNPNNWPLIGDASERLQIADQIIKQYDGKWGDSGKTLANLRFAYDKLRDIGDSVFKDLMSAHDPNSVEVKRGYSPLKITLLTPIFSLLNPNNFIKNCPQPGFDDNNGFLIGNVKVELAPWKSITSHLDYSTEFTQISTVLDQMDVIIKKSGFGGQGVHSLDQFQKDYTKRFLALGRKYFKGHYTVQDGASLMMVVSKRINALGANFNVYFDDPKGYKLTKKLTHDDILTHLGYVLNGYPTGFTTALASNLSGDGVSEAEWLEILSMIFDISQKLDTYRINAGIETAPYSLESTFYQQLYENQFTGGGCVPGRKNRIIYRLANLLRQWLDFGHQLA